MSAPPIRDDVESGICDRRRVRFEPILRFVAISAVSLSESVETTLHTTAAVLVVSILTHQHHLPGKLREQPATQLGGWGRRAANPPAAGDLPTFAPSHPAFET